MKYDVIVVGAGPAGLMASIQASKNGKKVLLIERNSNAGKKLLLTGNGRCNLTNLQQNTEVIKSFGKNGKFLYKALSEFSSFDLTDWFNNAGLETTVLDNYRVFPKSNHSNDVLKTLLYEAKKAKVSIVYNTKVSKITVCDSEYTFRFIVESDDNEYLSKSLVIATGGKSWPKTGSDGSGFLLASSLGHKITTLSPGLSGLECTNDFSDLIGISVPNIDVKYKNGNKVIVESGDVIFTHYGISGPAILNISNKLSRGQIKEVSIDLLPVYKRDDLFKELMRLCKNESKKQVKNIINNLFQNRLAAYILNKSDIDSCKQGSNISKKDINLLVNVIKNLSCNIKSLRPYEEAMITVGGINIKEINPATMESKLVNNLFFAGECLDLDAKTGGFNLQAAFSTGYLAGKNA